MEADKCGIHVIYKMKGDMPQIAEALLSVPGWSFTSSLPLNMHELD
jgi:hypothetical protein